MTEKRLERLASVKRRTGLCTSDIYKGMRESSFPKNFPLSKQAVAWDAAEVDAWIDRKLAGKNTRAASQTPKFRGRAQYPQSAKRAAKLTGGRVSGATT